MAADVPADLGRRAADRIGAGPGRQRRAKLPSPVVDQRLDPLVDLGGAAASSARLKTPGGHQVPAVGAISVARTTWLQPCSPSSWPSSPVAAIPQSAVDVRHADPVRLAPAPARSRVAGKTSATVSGSGSAARELSGAGGSRRRTGGSAAAAALVGDDEERDQPDDAEHDQRAEPAQRALHGALRLAASRRCGRRRRGAVHGGGRCWPTGADQQGATAVGGRAMGGAGRGAVQHAGHARSAR